MPGILVNPLIFLALVLLIGYFVWPREKYMFIYALNIVVCTLIVWPLRQYMSLDEGTFGCSLGNNPRATKPAPHLFSTAATASPLTIPKITIN